MKDRPPERDRRPPIDRERRFEANLVIVLAAALTSMWLLADRSSQTVMAAAVGNAPALQVNPFAAIAAIMGAVFLNFLFVRAETSLDMVKPMHVKRLKESSSVKGAILEGLVDHRARYVAACNLGSQTARLVLVIISFLLAPGLAGILDNRLDLGHPYLAIVVCAVLIMIPVGIFNLVVGELVPKSLGALHPESVVRQARFVRFFGWLFSPMAALSTWVANVFTTRFGAKASFDVAHQAEEEIKTLVESAQESGAIEDDEKELLHSVFEFTDTIAREVMTPRVDLDAVAITTDPVDVIRLIEGSGHSRIPIYEDTDDQIVGIVHAKDLLLASLNGNGKASLRELMRPALFVPENKNLHELLAEMRHGRSQMAVVQDEFGGTSGIVTIEDIIEELVGEIQDEYDVEEPSIVEENGYYVLDGKTHLDEFNDLAGTEFDSDAFDTIGGYVFGLFERQPKLGESIDHVGFRFTVAETDGRRVSKLKAERVSEGEPTSTSDEASRAG